MSIWLKEQTSKQLIQLKNENKILDNPIRYHLHADEERVRHHCLVSHIGNSPHVGYQALEMVEGVFLKNSRLKWGIGTYWFFTYRGLSWGRLRPGEFNLSTLQADNVDINSRLIVKTVQEDYDQKITKIGSAPSVLVLHIMSVNP